MPAPTAYAAASGRLVYPVLMSPGPNHIMLTPPNHDNYVRQQQTSQRRPRIKSAPPTSSGPHPNYQQYTQQIGAVAWANTSEEPAGIKIQIEHTEDDDSSAWKADATVDAENKENSKQLARVAISQPDLRLDEPQEQFQYVRHGHSTIRQRFLSVKSDSYYVTGRKRRPASSRSSTGSAAVSASVYGSTPDVRGLSSVTANFVMDSARSVDGLPTATASVASSSRRPRRFRVCPTPSMLLPTAQVRHSPDIDSFAYQLPPNKRHAVPDDPRSMLLLTAAFTCRPATPSRPSSPTSSTTSSSVFDDGSVSSARSPGGRKLALASSAPSSEVTSPYLDTFANPFSMKYMAMRQRRKRKESTDSIDGSLSSGITCPECRKILDGFRSEKMFWEWFFSLLPGDTSRKDFQSLPRKNQVLRGTTPHFCNFVSKVQLHRRQSQLGDKTGYDSGIGEGAADGLRGLVDDDVTSGQRAGDGMDDGLEARPTSPSSVGKRDDVHDSDAPPHTIGVEIISKPGREGDDDGILQDISDNNNDDDEGGFNIPASAGPQMEPEEEPMPSSPKSIPKEHVRVLSASKRPKVKNKDTGGSIQVQPVAPPSTPSIQPKPLPTKSGDDDEAKRRRACATKKERKGLVRRPTGKLQETPSKEEIKPSEPDQEDNTGADSGDKIPEESPRDKVVLSAPDLPTYQPIKSRARKLPPRASARKREEMAAKQEQPKEEKSDDNKSSGKPFEFPSDLGTSEDAQVKGKKKSKHRGGGKPKTKTKNKKKSKEVEWHGEPLDPGKTQISLQLPDSDSEEDNMKSPYRRSPLPATPHTPGRWSASSLLASFNSPLSRSGMEKPSTASTKRGKSANTDSELRAIFAELEHNKPKIQPWAQGRLALSQQSCRFELPMDMRVLESLSPQEYLRQYCVFSTRRQSLYQKTFMKYKDKSGQLSYKDLNKALSDVLVNTISQDQVKTMCDMVLLDQTSMVDPKLFGGIAALAERILYPDHLTEDTTDIAEHKKEKIESADFCALEWKFKGVSVNPDIRKILEAL